MKQELPNSQNKRLVRSFGRIKSRKLSDHKQFLWENLLKSYEIDQKNLKLSNFSQFCLEIGFGFGDFTFEKAKNNPNTLFFGCEPHINGVVNLLSKLEKHPLDNLKISSQDARLLLQDFDDNFFNQIFILFPDPWPKAKHYKRRLINCEFLDEILAPKLKDNAIITIATDHDDYKTWILAQILQSKKFNWQASSKQDWQQFPNDWVVTKYQKKAAREGRTSVIFNLEKR